MGQAPFFPIGVNPASPIDALRKVRDHLGIEPGSPVSDAVKGALDAPWALADTVKQGGDDLWNSFMKKPAPQPAQAAAPPPAQPPPTPPPSAKGVGVGDVNPKMSPNPQINLPDDYMSKLVPSMINGLQKGYTPQTPPPSQLDKIQPTEFPHMDEPQRHFIVTGHRATPPGVDPMEWRRYEDLENAYINKTEGDQPEEWKVYGDLMGKEADMSAAQQNAKFGAQTGLARDNDTAWQNSQLAGFNNPQEAGQYNRMQGLISALTPIESARVSGAARIGEQQTANVGAENVARIGADARSNQLDALTALLQSQGNGGPGSTLSISGLGSVHQGSGQQIPPAVINRVTTARKNATGGIFGPSAAAKGELNQALANFWYYTPNVSPRVKEAVGTALEQGGYDDDQYTPQEQAEIERLYGVLTGKVQP